jgi:Fe-S-cluster-containing dehydrogenase component
MSKWNLIIDVDNCTNCNACVLACHDEYDGNEFPGYAAPMPKHGHNWIDIKQKVRGADQMIDVAYLPTMCNHCDDAPCVAAAENGAVTKRPDGIVVIDPVKSKGQRAIAEACPYDAVWWNDDLDIPQAWTFDAHLLDAGWTETRGAQVCATRAMRVVKASDEEMAKIAADEGLEVLQPELNANPRVYYKNLWRFTHCFISGGVEAIRDGKTDCLEGAAVALFKGDEKVAAAMTDNYGEFKFDQLAPGSGDYRIEVTGDGGASKSVSVSLGTSVSLPSISLSQA